MGKSVLVQWNTDPILLNQPKTFSEFLDECEKCFKLSKSEKQRIKVQMRLEDDEDYYEVVSNDDYEAYSTEQKIYAKISLSRDITKVQTTKKKKPNASEMSAIKSGENMKDKNNKSKIMRNYHNNFLIKVLAESIEIKSNSADSNRNPNLCSELKHAMDESLMTMANKIKNEMEKQSAQSHKWWFDKIMMLLNNSAQNGEMSHRNMFVSWKESLTSVKDDIQQILHKQVKSEESSNSNVIHETFQCENCKMKPIVGVMYFCVDCKNGDFTLCGKCNENNLNHPFHEHLFLQIPNETSLNDIRKCWNLPHVKESGLKSIAHSQKIADENTTLFLSERNSKKTITNLFDNNNSVSCINNRVVTNNADEDTFNCSIDLFHPSNKIGILNNKSNDQTQLSAHTLHGKEYSWQFDNINNRIDNINNIKAMHEKPSNIGVKSKNNAQKHQMYDYNEIDEGVNVNVNYNNYKNDNINQSDNINRNDGRGDANIYKPKENVLECRVGKSAMINAMYSNTKNNRENEPINTIPHMNVKPEFENVILSEQEIMAIINRWQDNYSIYNIYDKEYLRDSVIKYKGNYEEILENLL